jgi:hypothetical protein
MASCETHVPVISQSGLLLENLHFLGEGVDPVAARFRHLGSYSREPLVNFQIPFLALSFSLRRATVITSKKQAGNVECR